MAAKSVGGASSLKNGGNGGGVVCLLFVCTKYYYGNITYAAAAASPPAVTGSFNYGRLLVLCPLLATSSAKNCTKMQLSSSSAGQTSAPNLVPKPLKNVQKLKETPLEENMPT